MTSSSIRWSSCRNQGHLWRRSTVVIGESAASSSSSCNVAAASDDGEEFRERRKSHVCRLLPFLGHPLFSKTAVAIGFPDDHLLKYLADKFQALRQYARGIKRMPRRDSRQSRSGPMDGSRDLAAGASMAPGAGRYRRRATTAIKPRTIPRRTNSLEHESYWTGLPRAARKSACVPLRVFRDTRESHDLAICSDRHLRTDDHGRRSLQRRPRVADRGP